MFWFMVHLKEKATGAVCFSPQKRPFVTSLNGLRNEGIECKRLESRIQTIIYYAVSPKYQKFH